MPKFLGVVIPLLVAVGLSIVFFIEWRQSEDRHLEILTNQVGKLAILPEGEEPEIGKEVEFAVGVEEGDQILIYRRAKRAFLYRPDKNRLVDIVGIGKPELEAEAVETTREYTFVVRNGAGVSGAAGRYAEKVKELIESARVVKVDNAKTMDEEESRLISFIDDEQKAKETAEVLQMTLGDLPENESKPEVDFLIIVGRDRK